jgi:hypothetical protein
MATAATATPRTAIPLLAVMVRRATVTPATAKAPMVRAAPATVARVVADPQDASCSGKQHACESVKIVKRIEGQTFRKRVSGLFSLMRVVSNWRMYLHFPAFVRVVP